MTRSRKAFTLVELLVVIGIIAVLVGILLPTIAKARKCARELRSVSGLRQMMLGYTMYHQANKGSVLLGYPPAIINGWAVSVSDPKTGGVYPSFIADRYPWRLLAYVSNIWEIIHSHDVVPPLPQGSSLADTGKAYTLSLNPTYGINAVYVGGHKDFDGFVNAPAPLVSLPNTKQHVVFKANEVRQSSKLIVFADSHTYNYPGLEGQGLSYLTPPRAKGLWWTAKSNGKFDLARTDITGVPQGWYTQRTVVAFFDGHVETMLPDELNDMRYWANWATSPTYDYVP